MKAQILSEQAPGGKRTKLSEVLPLVTPYVVQFFPIYACNFKCKYCHHSIKNDKRCFVTDKAVMEYSLFEKCIDELSLFPDKIKTLRFVGMGEPLMHKDIVRMVDYAVTKNVANTVEILTNGSLLTNSMSDKLISAGVDRLVVSLQGTSEKKYKEISDFKLNLEEFVDNLRYFYLNKKHTHMYLKIVDCALEDMEDGQRFFQLFGDVCDSISIETTVPIFPGVEFNKELEYDQNKLTQFGLPITNTTICPQPFYTMQINPDGKVVGCHSIPYPEILADCNIEKLNEIWNGKAFNTFRYKMLNGLKNICDVCSQCNIMNYRLFPEDDISGEVEKLKEIYRTVE